MTIASLDFGKRRIGLALAYGDHGGVIPLEVIERKSLARDLDRVVARLAELEVSQVIVGLPLNMDGTEGPQARCGESVRGSATRRERSRRGTVRRTTDEL